MNSDSAYISWWVWLALRVQHYSCDFNSGVTSAHVFAAIVASRQEVFWLQKIIMSRNKDTLSILYTNSQWWKLTDLEAWVKPLRVFTSTMSCQESPSVVSGIPTRLSKNQFTARFEWKLHSKVQDKSEASGSGYKEEQIKH